MFIHVHRCSQCLYFISLLSTKIKVIKWQYVIQGTGAEVSFDWSNMPWLRMMVEFSYRTRRIMDGIIWDGRQTEESTLRQVADAMVKTGLRDLGYQHLGFLFFRCFWRDVFEANDLGRRNVEESECLFLKVHGTSDLNLPWFHAPLSRAQALYIFTKDWHQKSLERHFQANLLQTHSSNSLIPSYSH